MHIAHNPAVQRCLLVIQTMLQTTTPVNAAGSYTIQLPYTWNYPRLTLGDGFTVNSAFLRRCYVMHIAHSPAVQRCLLVIQTIVTQNRTVVYVTTKCTYSSEQIPLW